MAPCSSQLVVEILVKDHGPVWRFAVGIERVSRDHAHLGPSNPPIQLRGRSILPGIERQECEAGLASGHLDRLHQPFANAATAASTMDDEFRDVCPMWLVRRPRRMHLDRADDSFSVARDENN